MKHYYTKTRPSLRPYCFPSAFPVKGGRATFAETLPIRPDLSFTLWKDWRGRTPPNETIFKAWFDLDAVICHRFLRLGNDWRTHRDRPKWVVVLEKKPNGEKHLHGIIECLPEFGTIKYAYAFRDGFHDCGSMRGFVPDIEECHNELKWKTYITKYQEREGRQTPFYLDHDPQRDTYEFDIRFSPNFPPWKDTDM